MSEKNALSIAVKNHIVDGNYTYMNKCQKKGITVYGDIAASLEATEPQIEEFSELLSAYFGGRKVLKNIKSYEEKSSKWEKYICNNSLSIKQLQLHNSKDIDLISTLTQSAIKILPKIAIKVLYSKEKNLVKNYIWSVFCIYANSITDGKYEFYPALYGFMQSIGSRFWGKRNINISINDKDIMKVNNTRILLDPVQEMQMAVTLHTIYSVKHYNIICTTEEYNSDKRKLFDMWAMLGIIMDEANELFDGCENARINKNITYGMINELIYSITKTISINLPKINTEISRKVNRELLQYTPNATSQAAAQNIFKFIEKTAVLGISTAGSVFSNNQQLINIAATTALSMFNDFDNKETVANILLDSGINNCDLRKCLEDSKKMKRDLGSIIYLDK